MAERSEIFFEDSVFLDNKSSNGGVADTYYTDIVVKNSTFIGNSAKINGGVFYLKQGKIKVNDSVFLNNSAQIGSVMFV